MKYNDKEFLEIIDDIIKNKEFQNLEHYKHHYLYTRLEHSMSVSYHSYLVCKILHLDYISVARAGLLHDLFFYDCESSDIKPINHIKNHPKVALKNAQNIFHLNKKEQDIILKHMWPITFSPPRYLETLIVTFVDKYCAFREWRNFCAFSLSKKVILPIFLLPI